jgi:hypothetical protein
MRRWQMNRNRLAGQGLGRRHEVLTDERLEELAESYSRLRIRDYTGARFEEYVANSDGLERHANFLRVQGAALSEAKIAV